uniref:histidine kinase n=1 Tax=Vitis vinifera TaxID=29760 RepID=F6H9H4_VITVI
MENDNIEEMDVEVLHSMWPEDIGNDAGNQFNMDRPGADQDMLEEHISYGGDKRPISILDGIYDIWQEVPRRRNSVVVQNKRLEIDAEYDTVIYWKQRAVHLEKLLEASVQREHMLMEKVQESIKSLERQSSPVEELSQILKRADNFLHFVLQNAPVVIGHQDKELRYRFIYNHFPSLQEEDIIGKTDVEIFTGAGVKESQEFKKEVLERGLPAKREITFETELFGSKTFLIYVEPVFSKAGDTIGVNYMGMDVTDQVRKREKMMKIREEIAVQKAKETELNKTIHITEETMRAKQMLATMSHEIRSPLSGVVSIAEILATTNLDRHQRQLLNVMLSSGDLVLQLINDILDLSKVESGVMKLEATKFRPREVVKHVLQTAAASLQKILTLEGHVADDVPLEVTGDVLRIRQILTNLISNAVKFTHEGKVGINLYVIPEPSSGNGEGGPQMFIDDQSTVSANIPKEEKCLSPSQSSCTSKGSHTQNHALNDEPIDPINHDDSKQEDKENSHPLETTVWIRCDVYDTGIGIPEHALPTLFKKYMQVSADHARKYGGTGLGLAICKQLVELMGGHMTVSSREHSGSTFTFILPYKVSLISDHSDDPDELSDMADDDASTDDKNAGFFQFHPRTLEMTSLEDTCSVVDAAETLSEPESFKEVDEMGKTSEAPEMCLRLEISERSSQCTSSSSPEEPKSTLKPKILLVEDSKINVMVTQSMMKQLGHTIDVVNNGIEAVRAVQCRSYDLILMDVCMPVMDGLQATRIIRSFEETGNWDAAVKAGIEPSTCSSDSLPNGHDSMTVTKRVPIIAMTANALSESADECYANGMDSFVSKPVTFQKLTQCLQQYLT